jgi:two-component system copper resistance phosphate regulon response regulator CusR
MFSGPRGRHVVSCTWEERAALNILVIEDEKKVAQALKKGLEAEEHNVHLSMTGEDGFFRVCAEKFDLVILDLMLPGRDGTEILRTLRQRDVGTPVLVLTARDALEDKILGLDLGADDYMVKPFAFPELSARVRALLRRGRTDQPAKIGLADLEMDLGRRSVVRARRAIPLTAKEFDLLEYLLRNQGHVVTRQMLARDVWKEMLRATPLDNVIDVHIGRLRRKVDDPFATRLIHTVRGVGFILSETPP